jgi:hypothetical protein
MAERPAPDWLLAQTLFAQGLPHHAIAKRIGANPDAVRQRAVRGQWSQLRDAIEADSVRVVEKTIDHVLAGYSADTRKALGRSIVETAQSIPRPRGFKHATRIQSELEPLVRNAKTVFGWGNDDGSKASVRIGVLNLATVQALPNTEPLGLDTKHALTLSPEAPESPSPL